MRIGKKFTGRDWVYILLKDPFMARTMGKEDWETLTEEDWIYLIKKAPEFAKIREKIEGNLGVQIKKRKPRRKVVRKAIKKKPRTKIKIKSKVAEIYDSAQYILQDLEEKQSKAELQPLEEPVFGWNRGEVVKKGDKFIIRHEDTKEIVREVGSIDEGRAFFDGYSKGWVEKGRRKLSMKKAKYLLVKDEEGNVLLRADKTRPEIAQAFIDGYKMGGERKIDFWHKIEKKKEFELRNLTDLSFYFNHLKRIKEDYPRWFVYDIDIISNTIGISKVVKSPNHPKGVSKNKRIRMRNKEKELSSDLGQAFLVLEYKSGLKDFSVLINTLKYYKNMFITGFVDDYVNWIKEIIDKYIVNLEAVKKGAMWKDPKIGKELLRTKMIRRNRKGWFDITPEGRRELEKLKNIEGLVRLKGKEPWEMTKEEFIIPMSFEKAMKILDKFPELKGKVSWRSDGTYYFSPEQHKYIIKQALSEGKPVPVEVLKDYPDLVKKYKKVKPGKITIPDKLQPYKGLKPIIYNYDRYIGRPEWGSEFIKESENNGWTKKQILKGLKVKIGERERSLTSQEYDLLKTKPDDFYTYIIEKILKENKLKVKEVKRESNLKTPEEKDPEQMSEEEIRQEIKKIKDIPEEKERYLALMRESEKRAREKRMKEWEAKTKVKYIAKEDIKIGNAKIKKGEKIKIIDEGVQSATGFHTFIIEDNRGRKFYVLKDEFSKMFIPERKTFEAKEYPYEDVIPGSEKWKRIWQEHPELQREMLDYAKKYRKNPVIEKSLPTEWKLKRYKNALSEEFLYTLLGKEVGKKNWSIYLKDIPEAFMKEILEKNYNIKMEEIPMETYVWDKKKVGGFGWVKENPINPKIIKQNET